MFTSIRSRHNFTINVYVISLMILILFFLSLASMDTLGGFQKDHQINTTIAYAKEFSIVVSEIESLLNIEKNIIIDNPGDFRVQVDAMRRITAEFDFIENMAFVRHDKSVLSSDMEMPLYDVNLINRSDSDYLLSGPYISVSDKLIATMSIPIGEDYESKGYLTAYINLNALREYLEMPQSLRLTSTLLINAEGWILASTDAEVNELKNVKELSMDQVREVELWLEQMRYEGIGSNKLEHEEDDFRVSYAYVEKTPGWYIVMTMEEEDYEEIYEELKNLVFIIFVLVIIITLILSRLVVNAVVKPIIDLTKSTELKEVAPLSKRVEKRNDEVTRLFKTYNQMLSDLKAQSEDLERQVEERTKDLKDANDRLYNLATTDSLTGSMNRMQIVAELESIIFNIKEYKNASVAVLFIDLNNFKYYNDSFGHDIGDLILIEVIQFLQRQVRASDFIGRYGGDEFIILLPSAKKNVLPRIMDTIHTSLEEEGYFKPLIEEWLGKEVVIPKEKTLGFSIGTAIYKAGDEKDVEAIIKEADDNMYIEKEKSKKRS